tara:strand:+ start:876 stop:1175 length:300 start_codon:yes stop_codon:yes gene_type:complete
MIINGTGVYVTRTGDIAYVTSWDGYRRAYGYLKKSPEWAMSWYSDDGGVRDGAVCGPGYDNRISQKLREPLPENAKEYGEQCEENRRQEFYKMIRERGI